MLRPGLLLFIQNTTWEEFITTFKTVGASAIISYNNKYIFEIQKSEKWNYNSSGEIEIGIGCIGGTIENSETPLETLQREVLEEIRTNIEIIEWDHPFTVTSDLNVYDINPKNESKNLFFHWFGTKKPYRKCRICVFLGKVIDDPFPDDLAGLLITDIKLLMECLENDFSLNQCLEKGMKIISKEEIPLKAKIKEVGTVKTIKELYKNHKIRIKHLLK